MRGYNGKSEILNKPKASLISLYSARCAEQWWWCFDDLCRNVDRSWRETDVILHSASNPTEIICKDRSAGFGFHHVDLLFYYSCSEISHHSAWFQMIKGNAHDRGIWRFVAYILLEICHISKSVRKISRWTTQKLLCAFKKLTQKLRTLLLFCTLYTLFMYTYMSCLYFWLLSVCKVTFNLFVARLFLI